MIEIPDNLRSSVGGSPAGAAWLADLPERVEACAALWQLETDTPFSDRVSAAWVARARTAGGERVVLKVSFPHMEAEREIDGLRFWDGDPTVRLLADHAPCNAFLLEDCRPGTPLAERDEAEQDVLIAGLLQRLWRTPPMGHPFRALAAMIEQWVQESVQARQEWPDPGLAEEGIALFRELLASTGRQVLLATDLHAGNVLRAEREPWLVIDPKPFVGDPCYDLSQHFLNCRGRLTSDPLALTARMAELAEVDVLRVRGWLFARLATQSGERERYQRLAKLLQPAL